MTNEEIQAIVYENKTRFRQLISFRSHYNPIIGYGSDCIPRTLIEVEGLLVPRFYCPNEMLSHPLIQGLVKCGSVSKYLTENGLDDDNRSVAFIIDKVEDLRHKTDFEYTAATQFLIKSKADKKNVAEEDVPFILNREQIIVLKELERARLAGEPLRFILLKARQFGGSTLVQLYMVWIQLFHRKQWNSTIAGHQKNTGEIIRGMYSKVLKGLDEVNGKKMVLLPYERSQNTRIIKERDVRITVGTFQNPDSLRGEDTCMAHCTEVAFWVLTKGKSPEDMINSVCSGIPDVPLSMIFYESTANGVGNFFHTEWKRAKNKQSIFKPILITWFDSDRNITELKKGEDIEIARTLTDYEKTLWLKGCTLQHLKWYRTELMKKPNEWMMRQEYPSDDIEAFQTSGNRVFNIYEVQQMREHCCDAVYYGDVVGDARTGEDALKHVRFSETPRPQNTNEVLQLWQLPDGKKISDRYIVSVDIGGHSEAADFSVIKVFDRISMMDIGGMPEVAGVWRGHIPHDLLAWKSAQIATLFDNALLIFESNTYETERGKIEAGDHAYILDELGGCYDNMYCRNHDERIRDGAPGKWGFPMTTQSKNIIVSHMQKMLRNNAEDKGGETYIERDAIACDEMDAFETKPDGKMGNVLGGHDDDVMCTMIGVHACYDPKIMDIPKKIVPRETSPRREFAGYSTF
ncbi:hypothetical protein AGMMS49965_13190 [Bacteroidia bacterium]|nr:hypothetical protein AGMMS49965_13190 [Bacteroidia bacterium]